LQKKKKSLKKKWKGVNLENYWKKLIKGKKMFGPNSTVKKIYQVGKYRCIYKLIIKKKKNY
jgi:hypothetical protein